MQPISWPNTQINFPAMGKDNSQSFGSEKIIL